MQATPSTTACKNTGLTKRRHTMPCQHGWAPSMSAYRAHPLHGYRQLSEQRVQAVAVNTSLFKLPLFTSKTARLPTTTGLLHIYEPRWLQLFEDMQREQGDSAAVRFGHVIDAHSAPAHLLSHASIDGVPKVGILAMVKSMRRRSDGTLIVEYEAGRRFQVLSLLEREPYVCAFCMHLVDSHIGVGERNDVDALERQVYGALLDVERLSNLLHATPTAGRHVVPTLPETVHRYAPPAEPSNKRSLSAALIDAGYSSAGHSIAMWQSQGSVYGTSRNKSGQRNTDPYQMAADQLASAAHVPADGLLRQELFSFAAASCLELENPEVLALLNSRDTEARLAWLLAAVAPYRAELQAKAALVQALGKSP